MTVISRTLTPSPLRTALRLAADPSRWRPFVDFDPDRRHYRVWHDHVHRVTNESPHPAVSLHVYAPRLEVQHDDVSDDGILRLVATRREGDDW